MRRLPGILLAAVLLAALTVLAWQFRFEHAGLPLTGPFQTGLPGWEWQQGPGREGNPDQDGVLTLVKQDGDPMTSVEKTFGTMSDVRFLRVAMEARWSDVRQSGLTRWATARAVIFGKAPGGQYLWPHDHAIITALGTRDWHAEEAIFDLPQDLGNIGFGFQHLGESGTFQIRNVEISVVRQRTWFPHAAAALTCLWIAWAAGAIAPYLTRWRWIRATLAGSVIVGVTWFLVFPQPRYSARPLVGSFQLGLPVVAQKPATPASPSPALPPPPTARAASHTAVHTRTASRRAPSRGRGSDHRARSGRTRSGKARGPFSRRGNPQPAGPVQFPPPRGVRSLRVGPLRAHQSTDLADRRRHRLRLGSPAKLPAPPTVGLG